MDNTVYIETLNKYQKEISDLENSITYYIDEKNKLLQLFKHSDEVVRINGFCYNVNSDIGKLIKSALYLDSTVFDEAITEKHKELDELLIVLGEFCNSNPGEN